MRVVRGGVSIMLLHELSGGAFGAKVRGSANDFFCRDFDQCHRCTDHVDCGWCAETKRCEGADTKGGLACKEWAPRTCSDHTELRR